MKCFKELQMLNRMNRDECGHRLQAETQQLKFKEQELKVPICVDV